MTRLTVAAILAVLVLGLAFPRGNAGAQTTALRPHQQRSLVAIRGVFGRYTEQAISVSWCESRWWTTARNGQYLGLFQMGAWERRTYGHGQGAWEQARAAYRYFVASGRDWSPWTCKPSWS